MPLFKSEEQLIQAIQELSQKVRPSTYFRVSSRERLLNLLQTKVNYQWWMAFLKRSMAGLAMVTLVFFITIPLSLDLTGRNYIGEAKVLQGEFTLSHSNEEKTISSSSKIQIGDILSVPQSAAVEVRFIDDSRSVLSGGTVVAVDNFLANGSNIRNSILALNLRQGEIATSVEKQDGDLAKLQVETPSSLIEAKNSDFTVRITDQGETEVTATKNGVRVQVLGKADRTGTGKKILAEAQAVQGYKVKIAAGGATPLQISSTGNEPKDGQPVVSNSQGNSNSSATTGLNETTRREVNGQLEIAQVQLYQAIDLLQNGEQDSALARLKEYRAKILQTYNLLSDEQRTETYDDKDLSTILTGSLLPMVQQQVDQSGDELLIKTADSLVATLQTLEQSMQEKIVLASVTVFTNTSLPVLETTNGNDNTNSAEEQEDTPADLKLVQGMDGTLAFNINNLKNLVELQQSVSKEKQAELQVLINNYLTAAASYINSITDWRLQQRELTAAMSLLPNDKLYEKTLVKLRSLVADRVSFIVTSKLRKLK